MDYLEQEYFFTVAHFGFKIKGAKQEATCKDEWLLWQDHKQKKVHYLYVNSKRQITSLKIYESDGRLHTGIVKYGDTVTVKLESRNLVDKELTFAIVEDINWGLDKEQKQTIKIKVTDHGKGEATFTIPKGWGKDHGEDAVATPRYFYLKREVKVATGLYMYEEFPRSFYVKNPNQTDEENKQNSNRIRALMLKIAKTDIRDGYYESNNAVILGEELKLEENNEDENKICECEARLKAFMRMIRIGEGTSDEGGYTRIVGGSSFSDHSKDMSDHPKIYIEKHNSTAAGAYQITKTNWNDQSFVNWRKQKKITGFSKEDQDKYCVYLIISKKKAFKKIKNGDVKGAIEKCNKEWASLPGAGYGQREEKLSKILKEYDDFLKEELVETSTLHIKSGFLKQLYGYLCCNNNSTILKVIDNGVTLHFVGETAKEEFLSLKTKNILKKVAKASNNMDIYITSTARTPYDQARIMYDNCKINLQEQREIYASPGQKIIDVYVIERSKSRNYVIDKMEAKIKEIGPSKVSKHIADPSILNTFDISYGKLTDKIKFWNEMKKSIELDEILNENKCYHIQIKQ